MRAPPREWETWLEANHDVASAIWLRLLNKNAPEPGMSYGEAVEIALCFGWIDSMARKYDDVSRIQRFSPRKPRSPWSASNVERVHRLIDAGRLREAGLARGRCRQGRRSVAGSLASPRICAGRHPVPPFEGMAERRCVGVAQPLRHFLDGEPDIAQQVDRQG